MSKMQASMQVTEAAKGQTAFFKTNNSGYGVRWEAAAETNTHKDDPNEVPQYRELVSLLAVLFMSGSQNER